MVSDYGGSTVSDVHSSILCDIQLSIGLRVSLFPLEWRKCCPRYSKSELCLCFRHKQQQIFITCCRPVVLKLWSAGKLQPVCGKDEKLSNQIFNTIFIKKQI